MIKKTMFVLCLCASASLWAAGMGQGSNLLGWGQADGNIKQLWESISQTLIKNAQNPYAQWPESEKSKIDKWGKEIASASPALTTFLSTLYTRYDSLSTKQMRTMLILSAQGTVPMVFGTGPITIATAQPMAAPRQVQGQATLTSDVKLLLLEIKKGIEADLANLDSYIKSNQPNEALSTINNIVTRVGTLKLALLTPKIQGWKQVDEKLEKEMEALQTKAEEALFADAQQSTPERRKKALDACIAAGKTAIALLTKMGI